MWHMKIAYPFLCATSVAFGMLPDSVTGYVRRAESYSVDAGTIITYRETLSDGTIVSALSASNCWNKLAYLQSPKTSKELKLVEPEIVFSLLETRYKKQQVQSAARAATKAKKSQKLKLQ